MTIYKCVVGIESIGLDQYRLRDHEANFLSLVNSTEKCAAPSIFSPSSPVPACRQMKFLCECDLIYVCRRHLLLHDIPERLMSEVMAASIFTDAQELM